MEHALLHASPRTPPKRVQDLVRWEPAGKHTGWDTAILAPTPHAGQEQPTRPATSGELAGISAELHAALDRSRLTFTALTAAAPTWLHTLPTRDASMSLRSARYRAHQVNWAPTEDSDLAALTVAVPYCDVVVTERALSTRCITTAWTSATAPT